MRNIKSLGYGPVLATCGLLIVAVPALAENKVKEAANEAVEATSDAAGKAADAASDAWITTKVKMSLLTTAEVPALRINVDTYDGRVTLQGTADTARRWTTAS
jgi:osmotically-inducible protein OsmY